MTRISSSTTSRGRRRPAAAVVALTVALAASQGLYAQGTAGGRVKIVSGAAFIVRQQATSPASVGAVVFESDLLRTGPDGRLGVTLKDDTRISLGPMSEVRINRIAYAPVEGQFGLVLNVVRGVLAYVSGQIARMAPDTVRVETPDAIIGIRGTRLAVRVEGP